MDHLYSLASIVSHHDCCDLGDVDLSSFNAVSFTSSKAHQYSVAVVASDFFNDTQWTPTADNSTPSNFATLGGYADVVQFERPNNATIVDLLNDARGMNASHELTNLVPNDCMLLYSNGFAQRAGDVVVVTSSASTDTSPLVWTRYPERSISQDKDHSNQDPFNWICRDALEERTLEEARVSHHVSAGLMHSIKSDPLNSSTSADSLPLRNTIDAISN